MGGMSTLLFGTKRPDPVADECAEFVIDPHGDNIPREAKDAYSRSFRAGIYTALAKHPVHGFVVIQKVMGGRHCFEWREQAKSDHIAPQPPPKNDPKAKPLWPMIIAECEIRAAEHFRVGTRDDEVKAKAVRAMVSDMQKRHEFGVGKYGVPLVAKNDRDHLSDAYQELLDAIVYLRAQIETMGGLPDPNDLRKLEAIAREDRRKPATYRRILRIYAQTLENAIELRIILAERDER